MIAFAGVLTLDACKKDNSMTNEATFDITSPQEGQMFHAGEIVPIKATLTGKDLLHGWGIELRKKADGTVLLSKSIHEHGMTLTIDETWTNDVTEHTDLELEVFAQLDHDGTKTSKIVNFHAHPQ